MKSVSAIITTYNRAKLLRRAIDSVLIQSYPVLELIIVDDASTDDTSQVVNNYLKRYNRVKYIKNERNVGACKSRNIGINKANGDLIAGLDDDDEWTIDRIDKLMEYYNPKWAYITSDYIIRDDKGKSKHFKKMKFIKASNMANLNYAGNQIMVDKWKLIKLGGFDENLTAAQDYDMFYRLNLAFGSSLNVQQPLQIVYINHEYPQITKNAKLGYINFYFKHIDSFTRRNKVSQIFRIKQITGGRLGWTFITMAPNITVCLKMCKYYLMKLFKPNHRTT